MFYIKGFKLYLSTFFTDAVFSTEKTVLQKYESVNLGIITDADLNFPQK